MSKLAIIFGSGFQSAGFLKGFDQQIIKTMYGNVLLFIRGKTVFLLRHGKNCNIPTHRINHKAHICALNLLGVEKILGICSTGSLSEKIRPGTILIPDDYINFHPESFFEFELKSITPELDSNLRKIIREAAKKVKVTVRQKGTYIQMHGPRLETKAETRIISKWADIAGMTMASEATLCKELGIPYAAICSVDNYANGILKKNLTQQQIKKHQEKNSKGIEKILKLILKNLNK